MSRKLKVLHLITDIGRGGAERFLIDTCHEFSRRGDVEFIIGSLMPDNKYEEDTQSFNIVQIHYQPFSFFKKNESLTYKRLLDEFQPDVVHTNRFLAEFLTSYYVNPKIVYVTHGHDNMIQLENFSPKTLLNKNLMLNWLEKVRLIVKKYRETHTYFISNSSHTHEYYQKVLPSYMKPNIVRLDYGFHYNKFNDAVSQLSKGDNVLKLINVGSFQAKKNQIFIVDIAKELDKLGIQYEINLLGNGEHFESVKNAIASNGLEGKILMRGIVNDVEKWYKQSHIYLHTAYYEPFGLVFLEAMAAGLPVVTLDGKGNRDIILEGKNGHMIFEQNAKQFAQIIADLWNDKDRYAQMSVFGNEFSKNFDIKEATNRLIEFYKTCVSKNT